MYHMEDLEVEVSKTDMVRSLSEEKKSEELLGPQPRIHHKQGWTIPMLVMGMMIAMSTSYQFGYNISVLNQPSAHIKEFYRQSYSVAIPSNHTSDNNNNNNNTYDVTNPLIILQNNNNNNNGSHNRKATIDEQTLTVLWSLTTTLWVVGGMLGAFSSGFLADKLGRKQALILMAVPGLVGSLLSYLCYFLSRPSMLMLGRFITGINCGAATQLGPMYMLEVVPYNLKGSMGTLHQLIITLGIFAGSLFGISSLLGTSTLWPYVLLLNCLPNITSLAFICLPESPRYSMMVKRNKEVAEKSLRWLYSTDDVSAEIAEMVSESKHEDDTEKYTLVKLLRDRSLLNPLIVAVCLQLAQQLSGINAIFFYSSSIYKHAGVPSDKIEFANLFTCAINFFMTLFVLPIMDRAGRRPLLLVPIAGMAVSLAVITVALNWQFKFTWLNYVSVACVICYVVFFAFGLGPIPCMITAELFRQGPRGLACSIAGLSNWFANTLVAMSFELIQEYTKEYVFVVFLGIMVVSWVFVYFKVPETKNKTFDQIAAQFKHTKPHKTITLA